MKKFDVIVTIYGLSRKSQMDYAYTAGVSFLSSRIERVTDDVLARLDDSSWKDAEISEGRERKIVKIQLPDGVSSGEYYIGNVRVLEGLHSEFSANNGMGKAVFLYCKQSPVMPTDTDCSEVLDKAIASGIVMLVPQKDKTMKEMDAKILKVSETYTDMAPEDWEWSWL